MEDIIGKQKKRLLFFVEAMGGGVFTYLVELTNELIKFYDIYIAYGIREQTPLNFSKYFNKKVHFLKVNSFTRNIGINDIKAFFEIRKIAKLVQPDIIHLHSTKAGVLGRWAFDAKKIPLFYTPHGFSFLMEDCSIIKRRFYKFIEWLSAKNHSIIVSCSRGEYLESLKLTKNAIYINNGINVKEIDNIVKKIRVIEHPFTVFTSGRICEQKNPKLFNDIAASLPEVRFMWIGDGELRNVLTSKNIKITGWLERKEAIQCAVNADVFLLTSLWEGLPISLLEAMALKKLCVVSNIIGNNDVIVNGKNGYLCETLDDYIKVLKGHTELGIVGRKDVEENYNTSIMVKKYIIIYKKILRQYNRED